MVDPDPARENRGPPMSEMRDSEGTRRAFLGRLALGGAAVLGAGSASREALAKAKKAAVSYQDQPKDGARCAACAFFVEGGSCRLVEGEISPDGWCTLYQPKPGA